MLLIVWTAAQAERRAHNLLDNNDVRQQQTGGKGGVVAARQDG